MGKRIGYEYGDRTYPHFPKCCDTLRSRGFVEHSFIDGLEIDEFFSHAKSGRDSTMDTALKTQKTGYSSRRLIKYSENTTLAHDYFVRSNNTYITSFSFGENNFDLSILDVFLHRLIGYSVLKRSQFY